MSLLGLKMSVVGSPPLEIPMMTNLSGFDVLNIDGLDPVKATIVSSDFGALDGSQYQSSRRENRNIVITLGFNPDYAVTTVEELRDLLYSRFMVKKEITLEFTRSSGLVVKTVGRIESIESPMFSQEPETTISVICFDPDFHKTTVNTVSTVTVLPVNNTWTPLPYSGSTPTGLQMEIPIDVTTSGLNIYVKNPGGQTYTMSLDRIFNPGEVVRLNSTPGQKYISLQRPIDNQEVSLLSSLEPSSTWPLLIPGANEIKTTTSVDAITYIVRYTLKYGGI